MGDVVPADDAHVRRFAHALDDGALVVLPIAGRYALAADALDEQAIERAYDAKKRPADEPMTVAVSTLDDARHLAHVTPLARRLADQFLPGPLVIALRARPTAPDALLAGRDVVWVRVPAEAFARAVAQEHGPVTATTAAIHGSSHARSVHDARASLGGRVALYADAGVLTGVASTVVDASSGDAAILLEGAVAAGEVLAVARGA